MIRRFYAAPVGLKGPPVIDIIPREMTIDLSKPYEDLVLHVDRAHDGLRLDVWLREKLPWRSRTAIQTLVRDGRVEVNDLAGKPGGRLRPGDRVLVRVRRPEPGEIRHEDIPIRILYEDDWIVGIDKQPGILTHPVGRQLYNTLINALHLRYRNLETPSLDVIPKLVHRLDRDTSGVLLVSKDDRIRASLSAQFEEKQVEKEYLAIVRGEPERDACAIDLPIASAGETGRHRVRMTVRPDGAPSRTEIQVVERFPGFALVRALPRTGRTHQIRVHLAAIGLPILCDALYGEEREIRADRPVQPLLSRQALHAERLRFVHPVSGERMEIRAELPEDLLRTIAALRETGVRATLVTSARRTSRRSAPRASGESLDPGASPSRSCG